MARIGIIATFLLFSLGALFGWWLNLSSGSNTMLSIDVSSDQVRLPLKQKSFSGHSLILDIDKIKEMETELRKANKKQLLKVLGDPSFKAASGQGHIGEYDSYWIYKTGSKLRNLKEQNFLHPSKDVYFFFDKDESVIEIYYPSEVTTVIEKEK